MRTDLFQDRKCIHVKLDKGVHAALRTRLFQHNLSMQEVFDEFAKLIATDDPKAIKIVEQLIMRKIRAEIEGKPKRHDRSVSELDHDALYDLIEEGADEHV